MKQPLRGEFILGLITWTIIVAVSLAANIIQYQRQTLKEAVLEARTHLGLVQSYRRLVASFGGVYAPSETVAPNPYLIHSRKNITTTDGKQLTLLNAAYLTRLVFAIVRAEQESPVLDRITSTKLFNPANAPDAWEKKTLLAFEQGLSEASEIVDISGKPYLRVMRPFMTEEGCLNCHGQQGYKIGDIRGGVSVSVPLAPYYAGNARTRMNLVISHATIWLLVSCGLVIATIRRRRSLADLHASENKYRTLHESMRDAFAAVDMQGRIREFNQAFLDLLGYSEAEIRGLTYIDLTPGKWHASEATIIDEQVLARGYSDIYEKEYRRKDGAVIPVELRTFLVRDEAGRPAFMWAIVRDITERKQLEESFRIQSRRFEAFFENTIAPLVFLDRDFNFIRVNKAYADACKRDMTEFPGHNHFEYYPSEAKTVFEEVVRTKTPFQTFARPFYYADHPEWGVTYWDWTLVPLLDRDGEVEFLVFSLVDVTKRKRAEESILRLNRFYSVLSRVNETIVRIREPQALYQEICRITVEVGLFRMAWIGMVDPDTLLVQPVAVSGHEDGYLAARIISVDERIPEGRGQTGIAIRAGGHYLCNDLASDPAMLPWRDEALERGYRSSAAFALLKSGRAAGSINVYSDTPQSFQEEEIGLLQRLADDIAYASASIDSDRELLLSHDTLLTILNSLDAVVYVADMKTYEVLYTNKYVTDIFGDVTGRICWQALQSGQTGPCPFCTNARLLDERGNPKGVYGWQFENTVVGRWYDIRDRAIRWIDGRIVRLEIAADITAQKKAEAELISYRDGLERLVAVRTRELEGKTQQLEQSELALLNVVEDLNKVADDLRKANDRLEDLDRLKSLFIASMSHELRTPLNSIIGFSSIVLDEWSGPLNDEQKKELAVVKRSGKHLLALINDVIDVSKVEAGTLEIAPTDFDLHDLLTEAAEMFGKEIADKGLALRLDAPHLSLRTDHRRLLQCVVNLVGNAVKFTEQGGIGIVVSAAGDAVEIAVEDTGVGIKEEDLPKLFRSFVRLDSQLKTTVPGTGLGLYLTNKMVTEILKGEIMVESDYGRGSRFVMRIPSNLEAAS